MEKNPKSLEPDGGEQKILSAIKKVVKKSETKPLVAKRKSEKQNLEEAKETSVPENNQTKPINLDPKPIVELVNIVKQFDEKVVLNNLNLKIYKGEFVTLLGASGSGKTTALRIVAGFDSPSRGEIRFNGRDVKDLPSYKRPTNTIFQDYALFPHLNVEKNIMYGLKLVRVPKEEVNPLHIDKLKMLQSIWQAKADQKRLVLDQLQAKYKELLLSKTTIKMKKMQMQIDELTNSLKFLEASFIEANEAIAENNFTKMSKYIADQIIDSYQEKYEKASAELSYFKEKKDNWVQIEKDRENSLVEDYNASLEEYMSIYNSERAVIVNDIQNYEKKLLSSEQTIEQTLNATTTLTIRTDKKEIELLKKKLVDFDKKHKIELRNRKIKLDKEVNKYIWKDFKKAQKWMDNSDFLYSYWDNYVAQKTIVFENSHLKRKLTYEEKQARVDRLVDMIGLQGNEKKSIDQLSGGMKQRVALARSIILEPTVLLLDEPLSALDLKVRQKMQRELKNIQKQLGMTFIFVTHDQEEAMTMSDKIAVMRNGVVDQYGTPQEIYDFPINAWVAKFIGESNLFKGRVESANKVVFLEKEFKTDTYGISNENVDIMLRPEDIDLYKKDDKKAKAYFEGKIISATYQGVMWEYEVDSKQYKFLVHSTDHFALNEKVQIGWQTEDIHVMKEDQSEKLS